MTRSRRAGSYRRAILRLPNARWPRHPRALGRRSAPSGSINLSPVLGAHSPSTSSGPRRWVVGSPHLANGSKLPSELDHLMGAAPSWVVKFIIPRATCRRFGACRPAKNDLGQSPRVRVRQGTVGEPAHGSAVGGCSGMRTTPFGSANSTSGSADRAAIVSAWVPGGTASTYTPICGMLDTIDAP